MREPQATSTLGAPRPRSIFPRSRFAAALMLLVLCGPVIAHAQIRGQPVAQPSLGWWISGGASAVTVGDITDGVSQTRWRFGGDPVWQYRATIEKALDEATTFGVVAGYGVVDVGLTSLTVGDNPALPNNCATGCAASTEMWSGMMQFRSGGGTGFHTLFEASGGVTSFRNFKTKSDGAAIPGIKNNLDLTGTLGAGFAYPLTRTMVLALVQDIGIGYHSKTDLPAGAGRTWRIRNTRASLRINFGGR